MAIAPRRWMGGDGVDVVGEGPAALWQWGRDLAAAEW